MIEWKTYTLGELTNWFSGGTPSKSESSYWEGDIPWISAKTMTKHKIYSSELTISEDGLQNGSRLAQKNDILLLVRGSGLFIDIPINLVAKPVAFNQDIKAIRAKDPKDQEFIYYWLHGNKKRLNDILEETGIGAGKFDTGLLKKLEISIPTNKSEQNQIVSLAKSLYEKFDLLHLQNKTLEQMVETLFRQWFVEEAKEDWEERTLSSIATFQNGLACQKFPPENDVDKLPVLKIKQLRNGFSGDEDWCTKDVKPEYIVDSGDVIFSWSASLMVKIWDGQKCVLNQHLFKVTSDEFPKWFYYSWCKHHLEEFISISASHATTMGHIKRSDLDNAMVIVPDQNSLKKYTETASPLLDKIIANNKQLDNLRKLRDTLLPKLMSGEVTISDE